MLPVTFHPTRPLLKYLRDFETAIVHATIDRERGAVVTTKCLMHYLAVEHDCFEMIEEAVVTCLRCSTRV